METRTPQPIVCVLAEIKNGMYRTVRHYEPIKGKTDKGIFSDLINISNNRAFAKSQPEYWVKCREGNKWGRPVTGLFKTKFDNIFVGDLDHKTNLLLMKFSDDGSTITAYLYRNYYTRDLKQLLKTINKV